VVGAGGEFTAWSASAGVGAERACSAYSSPATRRKPAGTCTSRPAGRGPRAFSPPCSASARSRCEPDPQHARAVPPIPLSSGSAKRARTTVRPALKRSSGTLSPHDSNRSHSGCLTTRQPPRRPIRRCVTAALGRCRGGFRVNTAYPAVLYGFQMISTLVGSNLHSRPVTSSRHLVLSRPTGRITILSIRSAIRWRWTA
jgi:hypothetical protein